MYVLERFHHFDLCAFDWCLRRKRLQYAVGIARPISRSADGHLYVAAGLVALVAHLWSIAAIIAVGFAVERLLYFACKKGFKRNRPAKAITGFYSVIQASDEFSFPSGHTSGAFLMAWTAWLYEPSLAWVMFPWATLVGISRVFLGVHFPTDCVVGALLGSSVALVTISYLSGML